MRPTALRILLLLTPAVVLSAPAQSGDGSAVYSLETARCPAVPSTAEAVAVGTEGECVLRCTLSPDCQLSVFLKDSSACLSLSGMTSTTGVCDSSIIVRWKLSTTTKLMSLGFGPLTALFYDFRKSYENIVSPSLYPAEPVNVAEQSSVDGVRLHGLSSSYVHVSTPGIYRHFLGQSFSIFFQGKLGLNFTAKCISTFYNAAASWYPSPFYALNDGVLIAKMYFANGTLGYKHLRTNPALPTDSVQRVVSIGLNYDGGSGRFAANNYFNGSSLGTFNWGYGPGPSASTDIQHLHDDLLIGKCVGGEAQPLDGWLRCWALLTGNLDMSQFDKLRSLCSS